MEQRTAQVMLKSRRHIVDGAQFGVPFWTTPSAARRLIAAGVVDLVGGEVGPTEGKPAGPTEGKVFAGVGLVSRSTDSAKSPEAGTETSPSALREDQASRQKLYEESLKNGIVEKKPRRRKKSA